MPAEDVVRILVVALAGGCSPAPSASHHWSGNNLDALERLSASGFAGTVAVVAQYDDDLEQARRHGAHTGFQLYDGAGTELADRAASAVGLGHGQGGLADE